MMMYRSFVNYVPNNYLNLIFLLQLHAGNGQTSPSRKRRRNMGEVDLKVKSGSLVAKLRLDPKDTDFVPLPGPLLRKYIAYARTYVSPR